MQSKYQTRFSRFRTSQGDLWVLQSSLNESAFITRPHVLQYLSLLQPHPSSQSAGNEDSQGGKAERRAAALQAMPGRKTSTSTWTPAVTNRQHVGQRCMLKCVWITFVRFLTTGGNNCHEYIFLTLFSIQNMIRQNQSVSLLGNSDFPAKDRAR